MIDMYFKHTQASCASSTSLPPIAKGFLSSWTIPFNIPTHMLMVKGVQLTRKLFEALCTRPGVRHFTMIAYNTQTYEQIEWYNGTRVTRIWNYFAKNQKDWNIYVDSVL